MNISKSVERTQASLGQRIRFTPNMRPRFRTRENIQSLITSRESQSILISSYIRRQLSSTPGAPKITSRVPKGYDSLTGSRLAAANLTMARMAHADRMGGEAAYQNRACGKTSRNWLRRLSRELTVLIFGRVVHAILLSRSHFFPRVLSLLCSQVFPTCRLPLLAE